MSEERRGRRQRAARLTDEGLQLLEGRLREVWLKSGESGRLTRAARAAILELSVGTAERLLGQKGNDKAVLKQAFDRLGLPWDDGYCEPCPKDLEAEETSEPSESPKRPRSWIRPAIAAGALAIVGVGIFVSALPKPPDPAAMVDARIAAIRKALDRADFVSAEKSAQEALRLAKHYRQAGNIAYSLQLGGGAMAAQGRLEEAVVSYKEALPFWTTLENAHERASLLDSLGVTEARLGRLDDAERHFAEALAVCRTVNDAGVTAGVMRELGSVEAVRGNFPAALKWYDAAIILIKDRAAEPMHVDLKALRALVCRDEGKHEQALKDLQECLSYWKQRGEHRWVATTLFQIASVHVVAGHRDLAEQTIRTAKGFFAEVRDKRGEQECEKWLAAKDPSVSDFNRRLEEYF